MGKIFKHRVLTRTHANEASIENGKRNKNKMKSRFFKIRYFVHGKIMEIMYYSKV